MGNLIQQITSAYEAERPHVSEKIYSAAEIPLSYESITPEWLTAVICRKSPGAQVVSHRLGPTDEGSSNRRKIHLEYNDAGRRAELPQVLFCKATHGLANRIILGVSDGANCEAIFYNYIRPELDIEAPVGYFAAVDQESFNSIIMLNDISKSVTEFCSHRTRMTRERAESQMRLLATVHGTYHGRAESSAALTGIPSWTDYFNRTFEFGMEDGSNQGFLDGKDVIPPRLYARYPEIWPKTLASVRLHDAHPKTYAHGDVHLKNWYVAGNGEMGLADWQCSHRGHWARDVCYAISTALTIQDRRAWEKDLLRYYLDRLHAAGGPKIPFDEAFTAYRQQLLTALTWWTITLHPAPGMPDMQPRDITLEFVGRIATAMDDLDSLDAFG